ncbi:Putative 3-ketoacyl-CoA thiolase [Acidilobus saccharovorans 345-15]|uniref:Putative 3-ketoacyl-CoA thiolase n=1 Tax=Acidilobus saccharovorans (strain DSM 16705 / JCM 18335 / VKM B-2471 / 345-15) TaxID=666510 RepID=D9Q2A3_ACIS3|nr:thiolase family protein [Acidilobus saccharovorans]ADL19441.1 Putative 3-ketoacyl-CoA thiolase [Acidilobus saccharovorans 345-15]
MASYIEGVGMVKVERHYEKDLYQLAAEAAFNAIDQAGGASGIDYIVVSNALSSVQDEQLDLGGYIALSLGLRGVRALKVEAGEASGLAAVAVAHSLIESNVADKVLVVGVEKVTEFQSSKTYRHLQMVFDANSRSFYNVGFAADAAMLTRIYMDTYNVDRDLLSYWPALMHNNAKENPYAMLNFAIKPDRVSKSQVMADPITLLDSYPLGDGAAALLLSSKDSSKSPMAKITAVESASGLGSLELADDPLIIDSLAEAYRRLQNIASTDGVDVIELHDSFTIMGLLTLETIGLAPRGKAAELVANGRFSAGGEGPVVNPSGGLKARGHPIGATGVYQVAEVALQVAGKFPGLQVRGARKGLAVSINGVGSNSYVALVEGVE